jgi:hypothetical protein
MTVAATPQPFVTDGVYAPVEAMQALRPNSPVDPVLAEPKAEQLPERRNSPPRHVTQLRR